MTATTTNPLVYLLDDDEDICVVYSRWLERSGLEVCAFSDGASLLQELQEEVPYAVCLDMNMPGMNGLEVLSRIREHYTELPVVVLTADETAETAVKAMKMGARDYLTKPVVESKLVATVRNAVEIGRLSSRVRELQRDLDGYPGIVGSSASMKAVFRQIDRLASNDVTVLIHGESGTGKELVARAIHETSRRAKKSFVAINSSAIPEALLESELFGHERGAFTGAQNQRIGRFEEAHGGTIFLDEIGELPLALQAKLLRVLQERVFYRLGGSRPIHSDFRLLTATHRDLATEVKAGRFREDLFFRLAVFELSLPPLRERPDDIPALVDSFLRDRRGVENALARRIAPEALVHLLRYPWPGNIRELQNVVQHAMVVAEDEVIQPEDLPRRVRTEEAPVEPPVAMATQKVGDSAESLHDASRRMFVAALERHAGNASAVLRDLNITRPRFYRMLRKFGLEGRMEEIREYSKPRSSKE